MIRNQPDGRGDEVAEIRLRPAPALPRDASPRQRTIVIRQGSGWQSALFLLVCLLLLAVVMTGQRVLREQKVENERTDAALAAVQGKLQRLESGLGFDARRRYLVLGVRDHILRTNPRISMADAYRYAQLAVEAGERYPAVDPLLLVAIGTVESGYDPQAKSRADARGLYQIWPSTGRLLLRSLGWDFDEQALYDPEKNTQAAALYLDILFSAYGDPQLVLAEYNGGPLNAGFYRAGAGQLAAETRSYVPKVLDLYNRLKDRFAAGLDLRPELMHHDPQREGKTLGAPPTAGVARTTR
jgi:hypothetical protein